MIQLQRASAGSGKTYTLARKFIGYLITTPVDPDNPSGKRRLCTTRHELLRSLTQILAITFTNKATAEMKERIIDKLAALADADYPADDKKVDYLSDFMRETGRSRKEIADVCRMALETILNNFSDFNVSTIDSFFQSVLRTFAYETNLSEGYQVEMDSDLLATTAINMSMEDINMASPDGGRHNVPPVQYWIERLMRYEREKGGKGWNIFARSGNEAALYRMCIRTAKKMENEEYKLNKNVLDSYFNKLTEQGLTFRQVYERLEVANEGELKAAHAEMRREAREFLNLLQEGVPSEIPLRTSVAKHADKILSAPAVDKGRKPLFAYQKLDTDIANGNVMVTASNQKKKGVAALIPLIRPLEEKATAMYEAWRRWQDITQSPRFRYWLIYRHTLLLLGMLQEVRRNVRDYLSDNGMVELSDTGIILRDIIGDSDVPFIYERLGTRLSHYLIDEFQDTSTLQWDNMSPLLRESNGRGEESLVIGDAKQSIYRFRNANSEIITTWLPDQFGSDCIPCGDSVEENTNWRSDRIIVEFNNYLFHTLSSRIKADIIGSEGVEEVYSGIVQRPSHRDITGYVAVNYYCKSPDEEKGSADDKDAPPPYFSDFGNIVKRFMDRGYRQKDIAFLVNTKAEGKQIIDALVAYNSRLEPGERKIEFVSEESLLVDSSPAVSIVIAAMRALTTPRTLKMNRPDENPSYGITTWDSIGGHYNLFVMKNGGKSTPELLERFKTLIEEGTDPNGELYETVGSMQAHTLPALVEQFIRELVSEEMMKEESPYLAAFQDLVLEYCEHNQPDAASFLKWWDTAGNRSTISSPEDLDAVKVMTIHKSKGLQFKCVVVPEVNFSFTPSRKKSEWLWVEPSPLIGEDAAGETIPLPPVVPVESANLQSELKEGGWGEDEMHFERYTRFLKAYVLDIINKAYVAFTRAEEELHIYASYSKTISEKVRKTLAILATREETDTSENPDSLWLPLPATSMSEALLALLYDEQSLIQDTDEQRRRYMLSPDVEKRVVCGEEDSRNRYIGSIEFGHPHSLIENEEQRRKNDAKKGEQHTKKEFNSNYGYRCLSFPTTLRYREPDTGMITGEDEEIQRIDARSKGKLLHAVLEKMRNEADLDRALLALRVKGRFTSEGEKELRDILSGALAHPKVKEWFRPGLRVMQERWLMIGNKDDLPTSLRPDRVVVDEKGNAVVVDFKFGEPHKAHHRQVKGYVNTLRGLKASDGKPLFTSVKGYLWYVMQNKVEEA